MPIEPRLIAAEKLQDFTRRALSAAGLPEQDAASVAALMIEADLIGADAPAPLRKIFAAVAAEACMLGAWCEIAASHMTVGVPGLLPRGALVPTALPAPEPVDDSVPF